MNEYIFYTAEGYTSPPNEGCDVENCQVLGRAKGKDAEEAKQNLLERNPWILECGFDINETIAKQLVTDDLRVLLKQYLNKINFLESLLNKGQIDEYKKWQSLKE